MLGCAEIPADIEYVDDARAIVIATVTNLQRRQNLLPSERGWAYRALLDAYRQQGKRNDLVEATCGEFHPKLGARERVACFFGVGVNDVRYAVRLTYLIPPLLDAVDECKLNMMCGVAISYYDEATEIVSEAIECRKSSHIRCCDEAYQEKLSAAVHYGRRIGQGMASSNSSTNREEKEQYQFLAQAV